LTRKQAFDFVDEFQTILTCKFILKYLTF